MSGDNEDVEGTNRRIDRELHELMQEIRAVIPGAEVLLGLLLTVAFTRRFAELGDVDRYVYFGTFVCSLAALLLLIAPSSYHRIQFRQHDKERLLRTANREMLAGLAFIAASLGGASFLVTSLVMSATVAAVAAGIVVTIGGLLWLVVPLSGGRR